MAAITRVSPGKRFVEFSRDEIEQSVTERFEKQVRTHPRRIAIKTDRVELTYDDLNQSANRLAWVLLRQSRDDNKPVAILIEHDAPALVAIFGALKASRIFILLDPALPGARIEQILDDSGADLIVTDDQNLGIAQGLVGGDRRLVINADRYDTAPNNSDVNLAIHPDSVSHILYTSGSTGRPKGVMRTHRNDLHNIRNRTNSFCISCDDRVTLLGSFSTGQGMADIYCALLNGATLLPRNLKREGFNGLAEWLMQEGITIYHSAATLFRHFVSELSSDVVFPQLRIVNVGGEPVTWKDVELYKKHFSADCVLVNEISCSEASTFGQFLVNKETETKMTVPVGYPVEDKNILILNDNGEPLSAGYIGEIAICSQFLSPGYWNRPDLTQPAFGPDRESPGRRIYRTGDLGRKSTDGCLEYLGRKDTRVKIRGYRVECYEIESALLQIPGVDQAFVTHRQDERDETQLVAYLVCSKDTTLTIGELRADLAARLPLYMVPSAFVFIDTLPLTPTGKIDRSSLPETSIARPPLDVPFMTPRDPIEESVAKLCSQILGIDAIGVHDNLFDLGGNSLSAMQIIARVMKVFQIAVSLKRFHESPTIAGLSAIISAAQGSAETIAQTGLRQGFRDGNPPLSFFQERLWFMEQLEDCKAAYNLCQAHRVEGPLNVEAVQESLNTVVDRHEILRTSFEADKGQPFQVIAPGLRLPLDIRDLRALAEAERNRTGLRLAEEQAQRSFDLARSPLLRALLIRLAAEEHLLVLTVHQMVCDGWSMRILLSEFWTAYQAICHNQSPSLPALSAQYSDFAIWQRQLLNEDWLESQIAFWQETLKGPLPILALPTDYPRPAVESFRGSRVGFALHESLTESLNQLSRQEGVTLFMTLLAVFKTLLYRYTGQNDSIVGFPAAHRHWGSATGLIGFFVNTLVARTFVSGEITFRKLLQNVKAVCRSAYAHQDLPFEKLVEVLRPSRDLSRNPVFQTMLIFQNLPFTYPVPPELRSIPIGIDNGTTKVDLTLSLAERGRELIGFFEYATDLFDRVTIERMTVHFRTLLEGVVTDPDQPIASLPFLNKTEEHQQLIEWNDTRSGYAREFCLHELFQTQVKRTPQAIAVEIDNASLSYRELNIRANRLAGYLRKLGVGPERLVAICIDRSLEMVIGLLGILKAGGSYLPLDPAYPRERLAFMLEDAGVSVLLTQEHLADDRRWRMDDDDFPSSVFDPRLKVVCLDRDWPIIEGQGGNDLKVEVDASHLAYVVYTSGSTGIPRGVQISHRSLVNCVMSMQRQFDLTEKDRWLAVTTLSFDIAGLEIYLPLICGARLMLASREEALDGQLLAGKLTSGGATAMQATPSTWQLLLDAGWRGGAGFKILCGGEALSRPLADQLIEGGALLWNLYGPTETTIWSTMAKVQAGEGPPFIGRPVANSQIYVLDSHLRPLPVGAHGELYIGGDGLARGYLNQPDVTAEKFIPNPYGNEPGSRLYRTGDLARYLSDGNIVFLGRVDNQVKIRGYRIELGEIESVINQHPAIKESVVVASLFPSPRRGRIKVGVTPSTNNTRDEAPLSHPSPVEGEGVSESDRNLIAYLVFNAGKHSLSELRNFLKEKLPEYMIPTVLMPLDALPLTSNGKLDRNALPPPDGERPLLDHGFVEPSTEIEELVAQIWREVLKLDKIGVHENFFELGGHSLLATRVVARLRSNFGIDLPLRKLFELPTIAELAHHTEELLHQQEGTIIPPIVRVDHDRVIPASFSQQRLWFLRELDPGSTAYSIRCVFSIRGPLDLAAIDEALNAVIARHEILRTTFEFVEGSVVQNIRPPMRMAMPVTNLEDLPVEARQAKAREIALEEARKPFDLSNGPLLRARLLRSDRNEHYLLLNIDHTILDGWSMGTLFKELGTLYGAFAKKEPNPLPPLAIQYADYSVWQRQCFQGDDLESEIMYWRRQLDSFTSLSLPTDYPRPALQTSRGVHKTLALSSHLTSSLKALSRREGVTLFMTLLAALKILLLRHSGQDDVVVGSTIAGRNQPEIEGLIGFFINALPLRTDLSGNPSFAELLKRIREVCLGAYAHQDLPFEKIVEAINPSRDLGRNPLFQIMFNMADVSERVLDLDGCEVANESFFEPEAKFDITLYAPEKNGIIELATVYNADLFSDLRIAVMLEQFSLLLSQIAEEPEAKIDNYNLVSPSTRTLLPDPTEPLDDNWKGPIHAHLANCANVAPDRMALVDANETWTYLELETLSKQLANYLRAAGIKPKDVVAIYADRRATLVLGLLGILRAGAVFVILDPAYPTARLTAFLRTARPKGWIQLETAPEPPKELANYLETLHLVCRVKIPVDKRAIAEFLNVQPKTEAEVAIDARDPAYIAFTSGSTGEPKGVLCRHGPITHFLPWQKEAFALSEADRFSLLSGLAYNHLHRDIFTALHLGATLYIPDPETARSPERLVKWLQDNHITIVHLTPALGELLLTADTRPLPSLRRIFFGGDVLKRIEVSAIRELAPNAKIGSFYGATETQRAVGYYEIPDGLAVKEIDDNPAVPLGRGIKDVQLLLLTRAGRLAGVGELGELYVRSPHLAEGYIGDEQDTNEKFVANPFTNDPADRLYRTGELGRYLPDGNIEWAGRNDRRVNIRGFRVELEEIEFVLMQHPAVKEAAVILQPFADPHPDNRSSKIENRKSGSHLVAYVAADEDQQALADLLHGYLGIRLPDYMVPADFLVLEKLPLSPNGKVDYQALPKMREKASGVTASVVTPANDIEAKLCDIFASVLGRMRVGVEENFFRLGGHSLLAAQAAARIREAFGVGFELRTFLESPTVARLAKEIEVRIKAVDTTPLADPADREEIEI